MSQDDRHFMQIMNADTCKNHGGNWEMPLPFRTPNITMPNNRPLAVNRLNGLLRTFKRKPKMKEDYFQFMSKIFDRGHAVPVPQEEMLVPASLQKTNGLNKRDTSNQAQTVKTEMKGKPGTCPTLEYTTPGNRIKSASCSTRRQSFKEFHLTRNFFRVQTS